MEKSVAWRNGSVISFTEMSLPVWDLGVVAGASVTEMARTYSHRPFRLAEHLARLSDACSELHFDIPWPLHELSEAAEHIVDQNSQLIAESDDLGIVIFVTAGSNPTYLGAKDLPGPTVGIHTFRLPFELWKPAIQDGVRLRIAEVPHLAADSLPVHLKTRNRLHWWLADKAASAKDPGSRALLLDRHGHVTETSTACFYAVIDGRIVTPRRNVLNSMSRKIVEEAASASGLTFEERDLPAKDIPNFQEAFLSSTPVGILQVRSIDDILLNDFGDASVVPRLLAEWTKITGIHPAKQIQAFS